MDWDRIMTVCETCALYVHCRIIDFLRWIKLPEEHWIWLDNNIFNGAL